MSRPRVVEPAPGKLADGEHGAIPESYEAIGVLIGAVRDALVAVVRCENEHDGFDNGGHLAAVRAALGTVLGEAERIQRFLRKPAVEARQSAKVAS